MEAAPKKELTLFDSTCIIVGIIIGAGIYETAPLVAKFLGSGPGVLAIWLAGGLLAVLLVGVIIPWSTDTSSRGGGVSTSKTRH